MPPTKRNRTPECENESAETLAALLLPIPAEMRWKPRPKPDIPLVDSCIKVPVNQEKLDDATKELGYARIKLFEARSECRKFVLPKHSKAEGEVEMGDEVKDEDKVAGDQQKVTTVKDELINETYQKLQVAIDSMEPALKILKELLHHAAASG